MDTACAGCGAVLPAIEGASDPYGVASPACWAAYGEIMAREFSGSGYFASHGMSVDAYMAQHPSRGSRAAVQSVWLHLAGLFLALERGVPSTFRGRMLAKMATPKREFDWLEPPAFGSALSVRSVVDAAGAEAHARAVRAWAESVWQSWSAHHARVRLLVDAALA